MEPKKSPNWKENHLPKLHFGLHVNFPGCIPTSTVTFPALLSLKNIMLANSERLTFGKGINAQAIIYSALWIWVSSKHYLPWTEGVKQKTTNHAGFWMMSVDIL